MKWEDIPDETPKQSGGLRWEDIPDEATKPSGSVRWEDVPDETPQAATPPVYAVPPESRTWAMPGLGDVAEEYKAAGMSALDTLQRMGMGAFEMYANASGLDDVGKDFRSGRQAATQWLTPNVTPDPLSQMGGNIVGGAIPTTAALAVGAPAVALGGIGAMTQAGLGFSQAADAGATDEQAMAQGLASGAIGSADALIPVSKATSPVRAMLATVLRSGGVNAGQQFLDNLVASKVIGWDEKRGLWDGVVESGIIGGGMGLAGSVGNARRMAPTVEAPPLPQVDAPPIETPPPVVEPPPMAPEQAAAVRNVRETGEPVPVEQPVARPVAEPTPEPAPPMWALPEASTPAQRPATQVEPTPPPPVAVEPPLVRPAATVEPEPVQAAPTQQANPTTPEQPSTTKQLNIGDPQRIMGVDSVLADTSEVGGVRYEVFNGSKLKEKRAAVRVTDVESGKVLSLKQYPDYDMANSDYRSEVDKASRMEQPPAPPPQRTETATPEAPGSTPPPAGGEGVTAAPTPNPILARIDAAEKMDPIKGKVEIRRIAKELGVPVGQDTLSITAEKLRAKVAAGSPPKPLEPPTAMMSGPGNPEDFDAALAKAAKGAPGVAGDAIDAVAGKVMRFSNYLRKKSPNTGGKIAASMDAIMDRALPATGRMTVAVKDAVGAASKATRENAMKWVNGRYNDATAAERAIGEKIRGTLDQLLERAQSLGVKRRVGDTWMPLKGSGEAFPEVPNQAGLDAIEAAAKNPQSAESKAFIAKVAGYNKATPDDALAGINEWREQRRRGSNSYLESTRMKLPDEFVEFDPLQTLPRFLERQNISIEQLAEWGWDTSQSLPRLRADLERLRSEAGDDIYQRAKRFLDFETGVQNPQAVSGARAAGALGNYQTLTKLSSPISALRNSLQPAVNPNVSFKNKAKAFLQMPPVAQRWMTSAKELRRQIDRSGAVRAHTILSDIAPAKSNFTNKALTFTGFTAAESGNQYRTALMAALQAQDDMRAIVTTQPTSALGKAISRLMGMDASTAKRQLNKFGVDDARIEAAVAKGGRLTPDDIDLFRQRMVRDTQFALEMTTRREWWNSNPWIRALAKFKTFSLEQTGLMMRDVVKEAGRGNMAPLTRFVVSTAIVGELYNIVRDFVTGNDESVTSMAFGDDPATAKETASRLLKNLIDGGGIGIMADMVYGIDNAVGGVMQSTLTNLGRAAAKVVQRPSPTVAKDAAWEAVKREVPLLNQATSDTGIANKIYRYVMGDKDGARTIRIAEIRRKARDFAAKDKAPPFSGQQMKDTGVRLMLGTNEFLPGKNTQLYQTAMAQLMGNNVKGAAKTLSEAMRDAKDAREARKIYGDVKAALNERGPLGPLRKDQSAAYLQSLKPSEREEAMTLEREWRMAVEQAAREAYGLSQK